MLPFDLTNLQLKLRLETIQKQLNKNYHFYDICIQFFHIMYVSHKVTKTFIIHHTTKKIQNDRQNHNLFDDTK